MTDFHYFAAPTDTAPGTLNPVFELLDFPIVVGGADDIVLTGPAPDRPMVDGREVTDPRLVEALSKPIELDRAEVLDRCAKFAGVLRAMGIGGAAGERLVIAEDVPPISRALSILGAVRIGLSVDVRSDADVTGGDGTTSVLVHTIDAAPVDSGRASVKVVRSHFEGVGIAIAGETANLDQAMRDSRVDSAEVVALSPEWPLILTDENSLTDEKLLDARSSLEWLSREILPEA